MQQARLFEFNNVSFGLIAARLVQVITPAETYQSTYWQRSPLSRSAASDPQTSTCRDGRGGGFTFWPNCSRWPTPGREESIELHQNNETQLHDFQF